MKQKSSLRHFLLGAASLLLLVSSASAQTIYTWDTSTTTGVQGGTGAWNTSNTLWTTDAGVTNVSWVNAGGTPFNDAIFSGTAGTVTLSEAISIRNLTFTHTSTATYTITGSTLNFTGGSIVTNNPNGTTATNNALGAIISSNITGAPSVNANALQTNEMFTFRPVANGSQSIGAITGAPGNGAGIMNFEGGTGHTSTVASSTGPKAVFNSSGTWTVTGIIESRNITITSGTVTVSTGRLQSAASQTRGITMTGGTLNWNNAGAIRDQNTSFGAASAGDPSDFYITGGTIDNTSGAAITTSTYNPDMTWGGNWTFSGSNGANSNLFLGNGRVALAVNTQVTVTNASATLTVGGVIQHLSGSFGLTKAGGGTMELRGASTYTGTTAVNAGTLATAGTGSINTTSAINVAAGATFQHNSSTALTVAPTLAGNGTSNRAVLSGTGTLNTTITLNNLGDVLSPGNSPGIQNFTPNQTWTSFSYDWELNDWTAAVAGTNFDQIGITGTLNLNGGSGSYVLNVLGLTASNASGSTPNFNETDRSWTILTSSGLTGFNAANWTINTAGFANPDAGTWSLAQSGNNLVLSYTAVPEPQVGLVGGIGALMLMRRRRR